MFCLCKNLLACLSMVEVTGVINLLTHSKIVDSPSPIGLLESLQPVGMGSKTILFNSMTK